MSRSSPEAPVGAWMLQTLPPELQVRTLSCLRAVDLSAVHQVNRYFWRNKALQHAIVMHCASTVYPPRWTEGFEKQPVSTSRETSREAPRKQRSSSLGSADDSLQAPSKSRSNSLGSLEDLPSTVVVGDAPPVKRKSNPIYTFEHLRNMELLVVARVLNSPEPTTGFVVSKSWCKAALCWLEGQQDRPAASDKKKKSKKKKKQSNNNSNKPAPKSPPPPPNINSDITCEHDQLQHLSSSRSARARRRLLDKQAWKILMTLYPESTALPAGKGECLQCRLEIAQVKKATLDQQEATKQLRKEPLRDAVVRRFYTRTRGVPEQCLRRNAVAPLVDGTYYVLSRSWCHSWRRFMKTGEGGMSATRFMAPDSSDLLCNMHRLVLLPPHLEAFLYGGSDHLLDSVAPKQAFLPEPQVAGAGHESVQVLRALGLSEAEIQQQVQAMRSLENSRPRAAIFEPGLSRNELLDRENHMVVEIVTDEEFRALERPGSFGLQFVVRGGTARFDTPICRACDATGRPCSISMRNRSRKKRVPRAAPGSLEY